MTHTYTCDHCGLPITLEATKVLTYKGKQYFFHSVRSCAIDWLEKQKLTDEEDIDRCFIRSTTD